MILPGASYTVEPEDYPLDGFTFWVEGDAVAGVIPIRSQFENGVFTADQANQPFVSGKEYHFLGSHPQHMADPQVLRIIFDEFAVPHVLTPAEDATSPINGGTGNLPGTLGGLPLNLGNAGIGQQLVIGQINGLPIVTAEDKEDLDPIAARTDLAEISNAESVAITVIDGLGRRIIRRMGFARLGEYIVDALSLGWAKNLNDKLNIAGWTSIGSLFSADGISAFFTTIEGNKRQGQLSFERAAEYIATVMEEGVARGFTLLKIRPNLQSRPEDGASFDKLALSTLALAAATGHVFVPVLENGMHVLKARTLRELMTDALNVIDRGQWSAALSVTTEGDDWIVEQVCEYAETLPVATAQPHRKKITPEMIGVPQTHGLNAPVADLFALLLDANGQIDTTMVLSFSGNNTYQIDYPEGLTTGYEGGKLRIELI